MRHVDLLGRGISLLFVFSMLVTSGCVATQDWVKEQLFPVEKRISEAEAGITQMGGRVSGVEGRVSNVEGRVDKMATQIAELDSRLNQTNAKADLALENLQRLKVDRKLVLDLKQGAFFTSNSTVLSGQAKKEIDSFVSDLKGDSDGMSSLLFVVTGHTDNVGSEKLNYELARIRAENAASYLTTEKKIDPGQLAVISYGESAPVADNASEAGRAKNRRVEILVYRENITVGSASVVSRPDRKTP